MQETYLTLIQSTCAARIFLNTFGLRLENAANIDEFTRIKIFDKDMNVVGELHFDNGRVMIAANYNNSLLEASYDIPKVSGFVDIMYGNALFAQWASEIKFKVENSDNIKLSGEFLIGCTTDSEYGVTCLCQPSINCDVPDKGNITLKIPGGGKTLFAKISSENYDETIDIRPWDELNGYIIHVISDGEYDQQTELRKYRKYMGVFEGGKGDEDKLHAYLSERKSGKQIFVRNELHQKNGDDESKELVIQKGMLMKDLDPDMFDKIKGLRETLSICGVSLLDNLFSVCYDNYADEELEALLGIRRNKMSYQDGANNLTESYFGVGQGSKFLSVNQRKRLLKNL